MRSLVFRPSLGLAVVVLLSLSLASTRAAVVFERIVQSGDEIPGDPAEAFTTFDAPATDGTSVSFFGRGTLREGIFTTKGGFAVVAERTTLLPGTAVNFAFFGGPILEDGVTLLSGLGAGGIGGIYLGDGGDLTIVADVFTRIPGAPVDFADFGGMGASGSRVVFQGRDFAFQDGIYARTSAGALQPIADTTTPIPKGTGTFEFLDNPVIDGQTIVFRGGVLDSPGLYISRGSTLRAIADTSTKVPGFPGSFGFFEQADLSRGTLAFIGGDPTFTRYGIYSFSGGKIGLIADVATSLPGGSGTFVGFGNPAVGTAGVVFLGFGSNGEFGLYVASGGAIETIIRVGDVLDGRTVLALLFQPDGVEGSFAAFTAQFTDGTYGVYSFGL